jgi:hypothetical protein
MDAIYNCCFRELKAVSLLGPLNVPLFFHVFGQRLRDIINSSRKTPQ